MSDDNCLDAASGTSPVKLVGFFFTISRSPFESEITVLLLKVRCHGLGGNQAWARGEDSSIRHR